MEKRNTEAAVKRLQKRIDELTAQLDSRTLSHARKLEQLRFYRGEISFEWTLLSNRVGSYITAQSFLVSAFAISMGNGLAKDPNSLEWAKVFVTVFPLILCVVGVATTLRVYPGIEGAILTINLWQNKQRELLLDEELAAFRIERQGDAASKTPRFIESLGMFVNRKERIGNKGGESVDHIHERSLYFAVYAPEIFMRMWLGLIVIVGLSYLSTFLFT